MTPAIFIHDGSFDGLLTAIAAVLSRTELSVQIERSSTWHPSLLDIPEHINTDPQQANRLLKRIRDTAGPKTHRTVCYAYASEATDLDTDLFHYVSEGLTLGDDVNNFHSHPSIRKVLKTARKVGSELHRMKGLTRFRSLDSNTLWAPIEPDHDILTPLAFYFRKRLRNESWLLHDIRRQKGIHWNKQRLVETPMELNKPTDTTPSSEETHYRDLWKTFFKTVAIKERANPKLQRQFMPIRYWKHLTEME